MSDQLPNSNAVLDARLRLADNGDSKPGTLETFGKCKSITVTCISEVGWLDTNVILGDVMRAGGPAAADQWKTDWNHGNAAGCCNLVNVECLDGKSIKFLVDTGWNTTYMDERFQALGIDRMLEQGEIRFLYLTHEHMDHFWGLEAVLKYNPSIQVIIPDSFSETALEFLEAKGTVQNANRIPHQGKLDVLPLSKITKLMDGVVSVGFDLPVMLKIRGEQSLYFNVQDKGLVLFTGCCHQNVLKFADFAIKNFDAAGKLYGIYGGLHIAPFGQLGDAEIEILKKIAQYGFKKIAVNHCTGSAAIDKMIEMGYPIEKGSALIESSGNQCIGNGDTVSF